MLLLRFASRPRHWYFDYDFLARGNKRTPAGHRATRPAPPRIRRRRICAEAPACTQHQLPVASLDGSRQIPARAQFRMPSTPCSTAIRSSVGALPTRAARIATCPRATWTSPRCASPPGWEAGETLQQLPRAPAVRTRHASLAKAIKLLLRTISAAVSGGCLRRHKAADAENHSTKTHGSPAQNYSSISGIRPALIMDGYSFPRQLSMKGERLRDTAGTSHPTRSGALRPGGLLFFLHLAGGGRLRGYSQDLHSCQLGGSKSRRSKSVRNLLRVSGLGMPWKIPLTVHHPSKVIAKRCCPHGNWCRSGDWRSQGASSPQRRSCAVFPGDLAHA